MTLATIIRTQVPACLDRVVAEFLAVNAEGRSLEDIARPLPAQEAPQPA